MRSKHLRSRPYQFALALGLIGAAVAGCSQDTSRFNDDPFTNPFSSRNDVTSSTGSRPATIESQPLAGPTSQPAYAAAPNSVPAAPAPAYTPAPQGAYSPPVTGSAAPRSGEGNWRWDGGTAVTLQHGETVDMIGRRYGVPAWAILRANNIADASRVQPGTRLVIPQYQGSPAPAQTAAISTPASKPAYSPAPTRGGQVHTVNAGETLYSLGRRYGTTHVAIAQANGMSSDASLRVGQRLNIPGGASSTASKTSPFSPPPGYRAEAPAPAPQQTASVTEQPQKVAAVTPAAQDEPRSLGNSPQFRWPVRGRVISGFGPKAGGQHNDGINLAVPEGADVKAAEDGVVAYAGNELKGYGNLVLIRHADGWMTAYAHNSQLMVKRGDQVRRGQSVARAGQTGGVSSPQLHFEIRKGSSPVDPTKYLAEL
ncbi:MAG: peptidoglycan DD-metalloendopeptidase family protein [Bradyrhizobiaceae bacterium]|nr:peptidoglycan DD-metalloendopeptidase family protein [Bradyrhizobiaceae bacterium]